MTFCIFCEIIKKEAPARIIYEDEHIIAFLDVAPLSKGHTLVVPKTHHTTLLDISPEELTHLTSQLQPLAKSILKALNVTDFNLLQNNGPSAAQVVNHLHFHIIPRPEGSLSWLSDQSVERMKLTQIETEEIYNEIKKFI